MSSTTQKEPTWAELVREVVALYEEVYGDGR
jgi:hypothetical protein